MQVLMGYAGYERYSEGIAHGKSQVQYIYTYVSSRQSATYTHTSAYVRALHIRIRQHTSEHYSEGIVHGKRQVRSLLALLAQQYKY